MSVHGKHTGNPGYRPGEHWNTCDRCGFDIYASDSMEEWNGLIVCRDCWEPRHELDFAKQHPEDIAAKGLVTSDRTGDPGIITIHTATINLVLTHGTDTNIHVWTGVLPDDRSIRFVGTTEGSSFTIIRRTGSDDGFGISLLDTDTSTIDTMDYDGRAVVIYDTSRGWILDSLEYGDF
jgi:phage terminase large subunit-like protein